MDLEHDLHSLPPSDEGAPDLECAICFSQFNNVFRTPKMLQCKHTFCLECLARINVKSAQPNTIQCPLCRGFTPLPDMGLPKLTTDPTVLSYLPAAMQRVYSIRFSRSKGRLLVKRPTEAQSALAPLRTVSHSLDVGLPNHREGGGISGGRGASGEARGWRGFGWLVRLSHKPVCRAFIMASVVLLMVLLIIVIIFLLSPRNP